MLSFAKISKKYASKIPRLRYASVPKATTADIRGLPWAATSPHFEGLGLDKKGENAPRTHVTASIATRTITTLKGILSGPHGASESRFIVMHHHDVSFNIIMIHHDSSWPIMMMMMMMMVMMMMHHHDASSSSSWWCAMMTHHDDSWWWLVIIHWGESSWWIVMMYHDD